MKISQYKNSSKKRNNKSFQKEIWDENWKERSFENQVRELRINPTYWRLLDILKKGDKVIEAGCGYGQWVYALDKQGYDITGVDIAEKTISKLKKIFPNLKVMTADVENLPFKDNQFNAYLSFGVIEHFPDGPEKVLSEAQRVLKKGGLLYLTIPYLTPLRFIKSLISKKENGQFYQYLYSKDEIKKIIENMGFKVNKIDKYDFITALRKDYPLFYKILVFLTKKNMQSNTKINKDIDLLNTIKKPNFNFQKFLYTLDSYILLIEAEKS